MFNFCEPKKLQDLNSQTLSNGRYYTTPEGKVYPSVTTVVGAQSKQAILEWRKRVGEEYANKISRHASSRGTKLHAICENYVLGEKLPDMMPIPKQLFNSIKPIIDKSINNIHYMEAALWSDKIQLAGRVDLIAEFDGVLSVIDYKTSGKRKKREYIMNYFQQCVAYSYMYEEIIGNPIDQIVVIIAIEGSLPQIFIEKTSDHIDGLFEAINFYTNQSL